MGYFAEVEALQWFYGWIYYIDHETEDFWAWILFRLDNVTKVVKEIRIFCIISVLSKSNVLRIQKKTRFRLILMVGESFWVSIDAMT